MFWIISIWISSFISVDGFILQDTYNVLLKDDADYKVDLVITGDDYEMVDKNQLKQFEIDEQANFTELNAMAKKQYQESLKYKTKNVRIPFEGNLPIIVVTMKYNNAMTTFIGPLTINTMHKRTVKEEWAYDYDDLIDEYYAEAKNESNSKKSYHMIKSEFDIFEYGPINSLKKIFSLACLKRNSTEVKGIGLAAIKSVLDNYMNERETISETSARLWKIFKIWFLVYLAVAVPLWCTRGWCCCCLCCKFFKPHQTIEEAKRYLVNYPPGVFKTKNGDILYEPTEREKECYEEFEHFIKTL